MGEVYLVQDTKLDRRVALKILTADAASNRDRIERFIREAKSAAALSHPNIAQIFEIGEHDGTYYIAMEYIDGVTLREKIHREKTELRKLLRYLQHVAEGLSKAHSSGIVHRDLKPDNIMITRDEHAKVLDFGLAKLTERRGDTATERRGEEDPTIALSPRRPVSPPLSTPGLIMGTVGYMSPEQAQGKINEIDQRSDIFSFGCILFEAATGKRPFEGDSVIKSLHSLIYEPAPQVKDLNPSAPTDLQRIVRRCLAKDREARYQSIKEVAIELKDLRRDLETPTEVSPSTRPDHDEPLTTGTEVSGKSTQGPALPTPSTISSAEYLISEIKKHKRGAGVALATLLVVTLVAGVWYLKFRSSASATTGSIKSIAVLPFENKSNDADADYLSDGLAESLIFRLSQLPDLKVSPTSSVVPYKGKETDIAKIAGELGVDSVMTGRLLKRGDNLTITVELVDVKNNKSLWGEQYERKMSDLLTTQREIATAITEKLKLKLVGNDARMMTKQYTTSNDAYQLYMKGRFHFAKRTKQDLLRSIEFYEQSITLDPKYALAYVGVAESWQVMPSFAYLSPDEAIPQAKKAVAKALELDPDLPEAHTAHGLILATYEWDWVAAEREFKRSFELDPKIALAHFRYAWVELSPRGRHEEAIAEMKRAMELDPLSLIQGANFAAVYIYARQYDNALDQAMKTHDLDHSFFAAQNWLAHAYNVKGMYPQAIAIAEKSLGTDFEMLPQLGYAYAKLGRRKEAEDLVAAWLAKKTYVSSYWVAVVYAALGEKDKAFAQLEKAYKAHDWFMERVKTDPFLDSLRDDPRLADLIKRVGLAD